MRDIFFRIAASHFQNLDAEPSGLNYFLKNTLWYTLIIHKKRVVDARNVFSHCSVPFSKFGCGTVWTELFLKPYTLVHSPHP